MNDTYSASGFVLVSGNMDDPLAELKRLAMEPVESYAFFTVGFDTKKG